MRNYSYSNMVINLCRYQFNWCRNIHNNWYKTLCFSYSFITTEDNVKLLDQLKSGFERTINWNKYQSKVSIERKNQYLDFFIDPNFQGVKRLFRLLFENNGHKQEQNTTEEYWNILLPGTYFNPGSQKSDKNNC